MSSSVAEETGASKVISKLDDGLFEVFLSYSQDIEERVAGLYDMLAESYGVKILTDQSDGIKLTEHLVKSKIFVCCISKAYTTTRKCIHEITLAYSNDKPVLALFFEKVTQKETQEIEFVLDISKQFNLYEDPKSAKWRGVIFNSFIEQMSTILDRKLSKTVRKKANKYDIEKKSNFIRRRNSDTKMTVSLAKPLHLDLHKTIKDYIGVNASDYKEASVNSDVVLDQKFLKLEKFKSNSLFETLSGFNRIVHCEPKSRLFITSSYNKSVVLVDLNGNWIERRNPNNILVAPWGICVGDNEILIGDNGKHCIFVFDLELRYLRTIGEDKMAGFYDLAFDTATGTVYAASLYDSLVTGFNAKTGEIKTQLLISTPTFLCVKGSKLIISNASDYIFVLNKDDLNLIHFIKIETLKYINGIHLTDDGAIFATAHLFVDKVKSKEVYLYAFKSDARGVDVKKINLGITQVNDLVIMRNQLRFFCICDTHVDIFDYQVSLKHI